MTEVPRCKGLFGWHRFEARYDKAAPDLEGMSRIRAKGHGDVCELIDSFAAKTYVHDICAKCGHVIKRGSN